MTTNSGEGIPQAELDRLVREAAAAAARAAMPPQPSDESAAANDHTEPERAVQDELDALLAETQRQTKAFTAGADEIRSAAQAYQLPDLSFGQPAREPAAIDLIGDVELDLRIELGRTAMRLDDVLRLRGGSVVVLDKLAGDPVDIYVNERLVARGEVLVLNDNFCVRVTELLATQP
jgi:flagellar motor switch protein FliN/FliY